MSTVKNLWGQLPLAQVVRTPVAILREQATQLTELTKGLLEGEVINRKQENNSKPFFTRLAIVAPALENYKFVVMDVSHSIMLYPVSLTDRVNAKVYECQNEEQFVSIIEQILSSEPVHKAIAALLSQSVSEREVSGL